MYIYIHTHTNTHTHTTCIYICIRGCVMCFNTIKKKT